MTLNIRILLAIGLLGAMLAGLLIAEVVPARQRAEDAQHRQIVNTASAALVEATGAMAIERGLTNGMLAAPSAVTELVRQKIADSRSQARSALARGLVLVPTGVDPRLTTAIDRLESLREESVHANPTLSPSVWFTGATAAIDAVVAVRRRIDTATSGEALPTQLILLRDRLAEMSEFGGRLRGMVAGLIARGGHASGPEAVAIGALNGRVDGAWAAIETRIELYPGAIQQPVHQAGQVWYETFGPLRRSVIDAAANGRDWPVPAAVWFTQASQAIDALLSAQADIGRAIDVALEQERLAGKRSVQFAGLFLAGGLLTIALAVWFVQFRVVRPLRTVIDVINRLAAGDLSVEVPPVRSSDEIGQLCSATSRFHETAVESQAMAERQKLLTAEALRARAEAMREVGSMIEDVSEHAIITVRDRAGLVVRLADQVHDGSATITLNATGAAENCGRASKSVQDAADGARQLEAAIRRITEQMERTVATTRSAVGEVEAARGTFDVLAGHVAEIGDVATLIGQIASQTNLLALNATIEAARAGEAGKGFAVVAGEVKALAQQAGESSARIGRQISAIEPATRESLEAMDRIRHSMAGIERIASAMAAAVEEQSAGVADVARGLGGTSEATALVNQRIDAVAGQSDQGTRLAAEMAATARDIEAGVAGLKSTLVRLMRTRVADLDRRNDPRVAVSLAGYIVLGGLRLAGTVEDLSRGGGKFACAAAAEVTVGDIVTLSGPEIPSMELIVVYRHADSLNLSLPEDSDAARSALAALYDRFAGLNKRAA